MAAPSSWVDSLLECKDVDPTARWNFPKTIGFSPTGGAGMGQGVTLNYSFDATLPPEYAGQAEGNGFRPLSDAERAAATWALGQIAAVCNVHFNLVTSSDAQVRLGVTNTDTASGVVAYTYLPSFNYQTDAFGNVSTVSLTGWSGDVWLGRGFYDALAPGTLQPGNLYQMAILHELCHAMGLKHPFEGITQLPTGIDDQAHSVMSYSPVSNAALPYPSSPMALDIAALQKLYGTNMQTGAGDDVYSFTPSQRVLKTIWDAGGYNTMDFSAFSARATLDLNPGGYSTVTQGGNETEVQLAYGTNIQKVVAGSGGSTIVAGPALRNIVGGAGYDTVVMKEGAYRFDQQSDATTLQLTNVEQLQSGNHYVTNIQPADVASGLVRAEAKQIAELYLAAFGRAPDADGMDYWLQQRYTGQVDVGSMASGFVGSAEYQARFANTSQSALVTAVYQNVLSRAPDSSGFNYWVGALASGATTPQNLMLSMLGGAQGSDRTLLNDRDAVSLYYAGKLAETGTGYDQSGVTALLGTVTTDPTSVTQAEGEIDTATNGGLALIAQVTQAHLLA